MRVQQKLIFFGAPIKPRGRHQCSHWLQREKTTQALKVIRKIHSRLARPSCWSLPTNSSLFSQETWGQMRRYFKWKTFVNMFFITSCICSRTTMLPVCLIVIWLQDDLHLLHRENCEIAPEQIPFSLISKTLSAASTIVFLSETQFYTLIRATRPRQFAESSPWNFFHFCRIIL